MLHWILVFPWKFTCFAYDLEGFLEGALDSSASDGTSSAAKKNQWKRTLSMSQYKCIFAMHELKIGFALEST